MIESKLLNYATILEAFRYFYFFYSMYEYNFIDDQYVFIFKLNRPYLFKLHQKTSSYRISFYSNIYEINLSYNWVNKFYITVCENCNTMNISCGWNGVASKLLIVVEINYQFR